MVICLEWGADVVSFFSKIQIGFTFLVQDDPGSPEKRIVKNVCVWACRWGQETRDLSKAWNKHLNVFRWQFLWFWQVVVSRWLIGHECLTCKKMHTAIGFQPRWWNTVCTSHWRHLGDGFFIVDIIQVNGHKWCSHCRWLLVRAVLPLHSSVQRHPSAALQCSPVARLLVPRHQKHKMLTIEGWQIC